MTVSAKALADDGWPKAGDAMRFLGKNGYDLELEEACKLFCVGGIYTVENCDVGDWSHSIQFKEIEGNFNGVMFERVEIVPLTDTCALPTQPSREAVARTLLDRRGFGYYNDPMEGGQDAYDITMDALEDADAILALQSPTAQEGGPKCKLCGLEDGACICAHIPAVPANNREKLPPDWKQDAVETSRLPRKPSP